MLSILVVTPRSEDLRPLIQALSADSEVRTEQAGSGAEAMRFVLTHVPHLVIIDSGLPDAADPLDLVRELLAVNAMINTAVVSSLSDREFHDAGEGLGILVRLPPESAESEAAALLQKLRNVLG